MILAAWAEGIGSCIASSNDGAEAHAALRIPTAMTPQLGITFGYPPDEPATMIEDLPKAQVLASLRRRPLSDLVHNERW